MRITSDFWIAAVVRRVFAAGGFAAVLKRGALEAGAIFVVTRDRLGESSLYGPAPQASYDSSKPQDRRFQLLIQGDADKIEARIAREEKFDPDLWVVELEPGNKDVSDFILIDEL
ncbi:MAG: DUF1491 family protein [Rhizobiaceae bacterium]|nr:DUF1491 family protein [Rhizobiaceae bacterium]